MNKHIYDYFFFRKGETCNHVAALLCALVDISTQKADGTLSSTSQQCKWNQPRKRRLSPKKSQDLNFTKHTFTSTSKTNVTKLDTTNIIKPINIENFRPKLINVNPNASWLKSFKSNNVPPKKTLPVLHTIDIQFRDGVNLKNESEHCLEYIDSLNMSPAECYLTEELSRGQTINLNWKKARHGRITASNFGSVCKRAASTSPDNLVKTLLYSTPFDTDATRWGRNHETAARRQYSTRMGKCHKSLTVRQSGLVVNYMYPHLGASPDGFVNCEHCEEPQGLLEIKCPFKYRSSTPKETSMEKYL